MVIVKEGERLDCVLQRKKDKSVVVGVESLPVSYTAVSLGVAWQPQA